MLFNTEGSAIRTIISGQEEGGIVVSLGQMVIFVAIWYLLTIVTYGVWVPAGLFLPGMIIGCAVGSAYMLIERDLVGTS
jgi:H+/Cl- antiporter ClcA